MLKITGRTIIIIGLISFFGLISSSRAMAASNLVEIFYLPHAPAEAVVRDVEGIMKKYGQFSVAKYSFEDPKSRNMIGKYKLTEHMPVVIFVNGKNEFSTGNRKVILKNFPKGNSFVPMFEGNWSYQDFEAVLQAVIRGK